VEYRPTAQRQDVEEEKKLAFGRVEFLEGDSEPTAGADRSSPVWNKRPIFPLRRGSRVADAVSASLRSSAARSRTSRTRIYVEFTLPARRAQLRARVPTERAAKTRVRFIRVGALAHSWPVGLILVACHGFLTKPQLLDSRANSRAIRSVLGAQLRSRVVSKLATWRLFSFPLSSRLPSRLSESPIYIAILAHLPPYPF